MTGEIVNKVAQSGLITLNLEEMFPKEELLHLDIKDQLWQGLALREKDFREFVKEHNWEQYRGNTVAVYCSADAIIPHWAYMLIASKLSGNAGAFYFGQPSEIEEMRMLEIVSSINPEDYKDRRIIIKGCSERNFSPQVYMMLVSKLQPVVKSIMFGEPCSTVPVYKKSV